MIRIDAQFTGNAFNGRGLQIVRQELNAAMWESVLILETEIASNTPVNMGTARAAVQGRVLNPYHGEVGAVGPASQYWPIIEEGRKPNNSFPPVDAMRLWVKRKLGITEEMQIKQVAYLVGRKIARLGIPGKFVFRNAERKMRTQIMSRFARAARNISRRLSG